MSNIDKQELREEFQYMQEHYSDPADRERQLIYIAAEALLDDLEAAEHTAAVDHEAACSLVEENEEVKRKLAASEKRIAELEAMREVFLRAKALMYQSGGAPIEKSLNPIDAWLYEAERAAAGIGKGE